MKKTVMFTINEESHGNNRYVKGTSGFCRFAMDIMSLFQSLYT